MAEAIKQVFASKKEQDQAAFITFLTAGFPTADATVPLMLAMEKGGADIIELGVPFSDPSADGPVIQEANTIAIQNGVDYRKCLDYVREARTKGLKAPVIFMGYYNSFLAYGEEKAVKDAKDAGANGYIVVDLPPEEAMQFRNVCKDTGMSYVPLVAPATTIDRVKFLATIADSFIYVVSKMGTTGSSSGSKINVALPDLLHRIRNFTPVPLAVGFGVDDRTHFEFIAAAGADAVVVGSKVIKIVREAPQGQAESAIEAYCRSMTLIDQPPVTRATLSSKAALSKPEPALPIPPSTADDKGKYTVRAGERLPSKFGPFGGAFVPEALVGCLNELEDEYVRASKDPKFWKEYEDMFEYIGRPSSLYFADRMTEKMGGARIWLKREDLNHTGSHKLNNAIGQILLAKRLGKTRIIAETGAGQHGVATATVCAKFGLECVIYMGAEDVRRQEMNVFRIKMLGATVVPVTSGSQTLKDAVNDAMRCGEVGRALPDAVVACVGGGSNAIGTFYDFIEDKSVRLIGVEAGGHGIDTDGHSATLVKGVPGVVHGAASYIIQDLMGQLTPTHSISAGLDYNSVGPEHAYLKSIGRAEYIAADDVQALTAFRWLTQNEGIIPALESSHALWGGFQLAKTLPKDKNVVICLSGNGAKDVEEVLLTLRKKEWADKLDWHVAA
ncbi:hypothetical protein CcaverHIS002_0101250 [Cutaneotrichosporon cavernicola]|nr:hypothetical protein CcaverHIS002_0101250 [Cutaneotrichosporon cavernicola]